MKYPIELRRKQLDKLYKFDCKCRACEKGFPQLTVNQRYEGLPNVNEASRKVDAMDWDYMRDHIDFYRNYLVANTDHLDNNVMRAIIIWQQMMQIYLMDRTDMSLRHITSQRP